MIDRRDWIAAFGEIDEGFDAAIERALLRIDSEERSKPVKRKMTLALAAAIIALLALAGAALAMHMNLFEFFGRKDERLSAIAPQAELQATASETLISDGLGETHVQFSNGYYDGESLIIAFTLQNSIRYASFEPTAELLARMETVDRDQFSISYDESLTGTAAGDAFIAALDRGTPCGLVKYSIYPSDHCTIGNGVDLPPWYECSDVQADGSILYLREFESPLPEEAQQQDRLEVHLRLIRMTAYFYFDGESCYQLYEHDPDINEVTAIIPRSEATARSFSGEASCNGASIEARAAVSAVQAVVDIQADQEAFPAAGDHQWYDAELLDEAGRQLRPTEIDFQGDAAHIRFRGVGSLPESLTLYIGLSREGEWMRDDFIANATEIRLFPAANQGN